MVTGSYYLESGNRCFPINIKWLVSAGCLPWHVYAGYLLPGTAGLALGAARRVRSQCGLVWQAILNTAGQEWESGVGQLFNLQFVTKGRQGECGQRAREEDVEVTPKRDSLCVCVSDGCLCFACVQICVCWYFFFSVLVHMCVQRVTACVDIFFVFPDEGKLEVEEKTIHSKTGHVSYLVCLSSSGAVS